jgi:hypothetical protein
MSARQERAKDALSTQIACLLVATGAYWFGRLADAPHWACWLTALLAYLINSAFLQLKSAIGGAR